MKNLLTLSLSMILLFSTTLIHAQDDEPSKEEYKKWKKIAREYKRNPMELKEKLAGYEAEIAKMKSEMKELEKQNENLEKQQLEMEQMVIAKDERMEKLEKKVADMEYVSNPSQDNSLSQNLAFYVQIGAYEKFNINHYFEGIHCMNVQLNDDLNKYVIGSFNQVAKAQEFKEDIQKMGIEDAWVVSMMDGKRIPMRDAIQLLEQTSAIPMDQINYLKAAYNLN